MDRRGVESERSMILVDRDILKAVQDGDIVIEPFDPSSMGTNSYDVHLGPLLLTYREEMDERMYYPMPLDAARSRATQEHRISDAGVLLKPGVLYLGSTVEYTESHRHVPFLEGKSSLGRLGMSIHVTAGKGDVGFCNHWTMEITVVHPLRVYAGMPVGQLIWFQTSDTPIVPYHRKKSAKYGARDSRPQPSQMWRNLDPAEILKRVNKDVK